MSDSDRVYEWTPFRSELLYELISLAREPMLDAEAVRRGERVVEQIYDSLEDVRSASLDQRVHGLIESWIKSKTERDATYVERETRAAIESFRRAIRYKNSRAATADWSDDEPDVGQDWFLDQWVIANRVTVFTGWGGVGKSRLILQMMVAALTQQPTFAATEATPRFLPGGAKVTGRLPSVTHGSPAILCTWEDNRGETLSRLRRICYMWKMSLADINGKLFHKWLLGQGPIWAPARSAHISTGANQTRLSYEIRQEAEEKGAKLLIIDSIASAYMSNENERGMVREFLGSWDLWADETKTTVILIAHPAKSGGDLSGSTDWYNEPRSLIGLKRETQDRGKGAKTNPEECVVLRRLKGNYGAPVEPIPLELRDGVFIEREPPDWLRK